MIVSPALRKSSAWSSGRWVLITRTLYKGQVTIYSLKGNNNKIGKQEIGRRMSKKKIWGNWCEASQCSHSNACGALRGVTGLLLPLLVSPPSSSLRNLSTTCSFLSPIMENYTGGLLSLRENQITLQKVYSSLSCSNRTPTLWWNWQSLKKKPPCFALSL